MAESLDAFRYISYLRSQWRWVTGSAATAVFLAVTISFLLPREYTATAKILIEPPAGVDPRGAMAVSPVYLESLKTYEEFASSDSLFQKAAEQFHLRALVGQTPVETLKRRVLKVGIVRNTRILEIAVTLPDARMAHQLAQSLAESAVALNRAAISESDQELIESLERQRRDARASLEAADRRWAALLSAQPLDNLTSALAAAPDARSKLEEQISNTELEIADNESRMRQASAEETVAIRKEQDSARARLQALQNQLAALERRTAARERVLAARTAERDRAEAERKSAEAALTAVEARLREVHGEMGYRGERLRVIDPGVIPERPSSPNIALNALAALLLGLVLPSAYLILTLTYQDPRKSERSGRFRAVNLFDV
jgi:succinoglycan biosynthesis transport protein ExoP